MGSSITYGISGATYPNSYNSYTEAYKYNKKEDKSPSIHEMLKDAREKAEKYKKSFEVPKSRSNYGDITLTAYAKLGRARNTAEVSSAAGYARRQIAQLRAEKRRDPDNADRIQAAINQLQKAVGRASKKRRDLESEVCSERRKARLEQENRTREAQRAKHELLRRKTMRSIRENGYIREAEVDNRLQDHISETRMELREQARELSESMCGTTPEMAAQQYMAQPVEAAPPEINIQA